MTPACPSGCRGRANSCKGAAAAPSPSSRLVHIAESTSVGVIGLGRRSRPVGIAIAEAKHDSHDEEGAVSSTKLADIPNALSLLRIGLVPVFLYVAHEVGASANATTVPRLRPAAVLVAIGASDVLDGYLARRYGWSTYGGAVLDAIADKLAQLSALALLALVELPSFSPVPLWFLLLVVFRDLLLGMGWLLSVVHPGKVSVEHELHGRVATLSMFGLVLAIVLGLPEVVSATILVLTSTLIVYSVLAYAVRTVRELRPASDSQ